MEKSKLVKFLPSISAKCDCCGGPKPEQYRDMVGFYLGRYPLVLCNSCSLELAKLLLDRFYPVWGDGPVLDLLSEGTVKTLENSDTKPV